MSKTKRHKTYKPSLLRVPITKAMIDETCLIALGNLTALRLHPSYAAFDTLANLFNMVGIATDKRFDLKDEFRLIQSAALAMEDIRKRSEKFGEIKCNDREYSTIANAITRLHLVLPRLNCRELYIAQEELRNG